MACFSCYLGYLPSKGLFNRYSLIQVVEDQDANENKPY